MVSSGVQKKHNTALLPGTEMRPCREVQTPILLVVCDLLKVSCHSLSHQLSWGSPEPQQPLRVCPLHPDFPADHQRSRRPTASVVNLCPSSCSARLGNTDVLGCLPSLGSRCWQHPGSEHCRDMGAAQIGPPWGPVAFLWATTALLCHPER